MFFLVDFGILLNDLLKRYLSMLIDTLIFIGVIDVDRRPFCRQDGIRGGHFRNKVLLIFVFR